MVESPANLIMEDVRAHFDAALKAEFGPQAWCTNNMTEDPTKVPVARTPFVALWQTEEQGPEHEAAQPILEVAKEVRALLWVKGFKNNDEVQKALNRVVWCMARSAWTLSRAGGRPVRALRRGYAWGTNAGDSEGEAVFLFLLAYKASLTP
jgi:hypothetical protein